MSERGRISAAVIVCHGRMQRALQCSAQSERGHDGSEFGWPGNLTGCSLRPQLRGIDHDPAFEQSFEIAQSTISWAGDRDETQMREIIDDAAHSAIRYP